MSDKRSSSASGDTESEAPPAGEAPSAADRKAAKAAADRAAGTEYQLPKIDISTFIFSLNSAAYVQLGLLEDPAGGKRERNLPLAKQTIDLLGMLEEKTRGNLSREEENMLRHILYDLRMLYVKEKG